MDAGAWGFQGGQSGAGLRLGLSYPTDTNQASLAFSRGYSFGLNYFLTPWDWLVLGLEGNGYLTNARTLYQVGPEDAANRIVTRVKTRARTVSALATARINLVFDQPWTIYVKGGAGIHKTTIREFSFVLNQVGGASAETRQGQSDRGLATMAAGGLEAFTNRNVTVFIEARYDEFRIPNKLGANSLEFLSYQLGFHYWFGLR